MERSCEENRHRYKHLIVVVAPKRDVMCLMICYSFDTQQSIEHLKMTNVCQKLIKSLIRAEFLGYG